MRRVPKDAVVSYTIGQLHNLLTLFSGSNMSDTDYALIEQFLQFVHGAAVTHGAPPPIIAAAVQDLARLDWLEELAGAEICQHLRGGMGRVLWRSGGVISARAALDAVMSEETADPNATLVPAFSPVLGGPE